MRTKVELWIGGLRADLSDQGLILFNWAFDDAGNPTAVLNSYSQQVTLPGTPDNDKIFGCFWRSDRVTTSNGNVTGTDFDARKRVPFALYASTGEILQAGYVRLDSVSRNRDKVSYKVTLFGDLGNFVQALSVNGDGSAMTLADLDYITGNEDELDFIINAYNVKTAWTQLAGTPSDLWATINFAPAYEGIPDKDFDAAKELAAPADVGVSPSYYDADAGKTYGTKSGVTMLNLPAAVDQWAAKDFRSYLQRPVISFRKVLTAIVAKASESGYTLDLSALTGGTYDPDNLWLTLKPLTSLAPKEVTGATIILDGTPKDQNDVGAWTITANDVPSGSKGTASVNFRIALTMSSTIPAPSMVDTGTRMGLWHDTYRSVAFVRLVARNGGANGTIVGRSKYLAINAFPGYTPLSQYNYCLGTDSGLTDSDFYAGIPSATLSVVDATTAKTDESYALTVEGTDIDYVGLESHCWVLRYSTNPYVPSLDGFTDATGSGAAMPAVFRGGMAYLATYWTTAAGAGSDSVSFDLPSTIRSGARITKRMLLGSTKTPADYLLSWVKAIGYCFAVDDATKTVTLLSRGSFFNGGTGDLTGRVDVSSVTVVPTGVTSRNYEFSEESKGKFADAYAQTYGVQYGSQRVDTGYEFSDEVKALLTSSAFRGAVTALERSKYFNYIIRTGDSSFCPSVFLDSGVTQTLWTAQDESTEIPVPVPAANAVSITYYNQNGSEWEGYDADFARKLQLHTADGKQVDGDDVLVFLDGFQQYEYFGVSDDSALMYELTGGKACWVFGGTAAGVTVPIFGRMQYSGGGYNIAATLDFGRVRELAMPYTQYKASGAVTLYERCWRDYLLDRFDRDARVVTAKVQLRGLPVGQELLRRLWWWDGALWAMNKVKNHSVTTEAPTEVELVKVMDADDYTNGQDLT